MHQSKNRFDTKGSVKTMMAVVTTGNGGYDKLEYRNVPVPKLQAGEVLIEVLAAGVNNTEINIPKSNIFLFFLKRYGIIEGGIVFNRDNRVLRLPK